MTRVEINEQMEAFGFTESIAPLLFMHPQIGYIQLSATTTLEQIILIIFEAGKRNKAEEITKALYIQQR